jgi:hypothetical protein
VRLPLRLLQWTYDNKVSKNVGIQIYAGLNSDADIGMLVKLSFNAEYTESIGLNN